MSQNRRSIDLIVVFLISFCLLITSAVRGIFIAYPLLLALLMLSAVLLKRGFTPATIVKMALAGARQSLPVVQVLLLIGMVTAVWMAAGTVPALVYYGTGLISGQFFLLWAFLLTSVVSTLTGTAFGAAGTMGIALMVMARGSGLPAEPVGGAIIAGAFVGDRCSPMSSSAHLVASITQSDLYTNLRNMLRSSIWPLGLSIVFYTLLSLRYPAQLTGTAITTELPNAFNLAPGTLLPAGAIVLLAVLRVDVKLAMLVSLAVGGVIAHTLQGHAFTDLLRFTLVGYQLEQNSPLNTILLGGGLLPMAKATVVVVISTAFAGIFSGSRILSFLNRPLRRIRTVRQRSQATILVSILTSLFGCTQTIAILLTAQIMQPHALPVAHQHSDRQQLALLIEDSAVVIAPLIPWNIAGLIPATILTVGPGFIPYAVYLFLLPLFAGLRSPLNRKTATASIV